MGATNVVNAANAAAVWTADHAAAKNDAAAADVDDGTVAANAIRGAAQYAAGITTNIHDDAKTAVWHAKSLWANLLRGRGGF